MTSQLESLVLSEKSHKEKENTTLTKKTQEIPQDHTVILEQNMESVMHDSMIPYSEHVILERAIPRVEDGLKPVQRRVLYTMYEQGLTPDKPFRKSANIVGECMAKYHPHGDSSIYDTMVRLAQDFNMRTPLVEGNGNFGSMDGDSAAAFRYTEARLAAPALAMMDYLGKDTVSWSLNFDDTRKEPDVLPACLPNLLINGASGTGKEYVAHRIHLQSQRAGKPFVAIDCGA